MKTLNQIENLFLKIDGQKINNLTPEKECEVYFGYNFTLNSQSFKFRKAKVTPKKVGQFVTLWKRNSVKKIEPFEETDAFDFFIFAAEQDEKLGFFIFPKALLIEQNILTTKLQEGKRGFRIYPTWTITANKQAKNTQVWQTSYFIDFTNSEQNNIEKLKLLLSPKV